MILISQVWCHAKEYAMSNYFSKKCSLHFWKTAFSFILERRKRDTVSVLEELSCNNLQQSSLEPYEIATTLLSSVHVRKLKHNGVSELTLYQVILLESNQTGIWTNAFWNQRHELEEDYLSPWIVMPYVSITFSHLVLFLSSLVYSVCSFNH